MTDDDAGKRYVQGLIARAVLAPAEDDLWLRQKTANFQTAQMSFQLTQSTRRSKMFFLMMMCLRLILSARPYRTFHLLVKAKITRKNGKNPPYHAHTSLDTLLGGADQLSAPHNREPQTLPKAEGAIIPNFRSIAPLHRREQGCYPLHPH